MNDHASPRNPHDFLMTPKGLVASRAERAAIGQDRLSPGAIRSRELLRGATVRETTGPRRRAVGASFGRLAIGIAAARARGVEAIVIVRIAVIRRALQRRGRFLVPQAFHDPSVQSRTHDRRLGAELREGGDDLLPVEVHRDALCGADGLQSSGRWCHK
jgi:hypothetical protein